MFLSRKMQGYMWFVMFGLVTSAISMLIWGFVHLKWYVVICNYLLGAALSGLMLFVLSLLFGGTVRYLFGLVGWLPTVLTAVYCWLFAGGNP